MQNDAANAMLNLGVIHRILENYDKATQRLELIDQAGTDGARVVATGQHDHVEVREGHATEAPAADGCDG